jgi:heptosyltransferase-2
MKSDEPLEILVRAPNWLGDLVMSTPGFRALRAGFPSARIHLQLPSELAPLLAGAPWFDALIPQKAHAGLRETLRAGRRLASLRRFDLGLCIPESFSSALEMRIAGVRRIVGTGRSGRGALLHQRVALPAPTPGRGAPRSRIAREAFVLGLTDALGCERRGSHLELFTTAAEEARAARVLAAAHPGGSPGDGWAFLVPGSAYGPAKRWPPARFAAVGDDLARNGLCVGVLGTPSERLLADAVCKAMQAPACNLAGVLDLGALKVAVRDARAVVCNDSGVRHIAVAFGVPCVVLLGPTRLEKTGMNLGGISVLESDVTCRPCYQRRCPIDHRCMTEIAPSDVVAALGRLGGDGAAFAGRPA